MRSKFRGGGFIAVLILIVAAAVAFDFASEKIPNILIILGILAGLYYRIGFLHDGAIGKIVFDLFFPLMLFFIFFVIKAFGAGDIKLLMVCGLFLGTANNLRCICLALLTAAMIGLFRLLIQGKLLSRFGSLFLYLKFLVVKLRYGNGEIEPYLSKERTERVAKIHFSLPILTGVLLVVLFNRLNG